MPMDKPLCNHKIAVLIESQYIPSELKDYEDYFTGAGADVQFMSCLGGDPERTYISEVEDDLSKVTDLESLKRIQENKTVTIDLARFFLNQSDPKRLRLEDYSAIIMSANYTSVRLRWWAQAVELFATAMQDRRIIKGALCHGLWILTPRPDLMSGRKVICHEVVQADIQNAGAVVTPTQSGIVIDDDLVTGKSYKEATAMAEAIAGQILSRNPLR